MDIKTLLRSIDIWSQWNHTFGAQADRLYHIFSTRTELLYEIMRVLASARSATPTQRWLRRWDHLRTALPPDVMRSLLIGLAGKPMWYAGPASDEEREMLCDFEALSPDMRERYSRTRIPTQELSMGLPFAELRQQNGSTRLWRKWQGSWYRYLPTIDAAKVRRISYGACWALADYPDEEVRQLLTQLLRKGIYAAAAALGQIGDDQAAWCLAYSASRTVNTTLRLHCQKALEQLATSRGLIAEDVLDQAIPAGELDGQGQRNWQCDEYQIRLTLTRGSNFLRRVLDPAGKVRNHLPEQLQKKYLHLWLLTASIRKDTAHILKMQKERLEHAMAVGRSWKYERWQAVFSHHALLAILASRLVWQLTNTDGSVTYALQLENGSWHSIDSKPVFPEPDTLLRLAHPAIMTPQEHHAWQKVLVMHDIVQPFKQMFRECYVLTPAEEETRVYSNRFAGFTLSYYGMQSLARKKEWSSVHNTYYREFPECGLRVYLWHEGYYAHRAYSHILHQIAFYPLDHPLLFGRPDLELDPACQELRVVPARILSEVMRDIDCFLLARSTGRVPVEAINKREVRDRGHHEVLTMRANLVHEIFEILGFGERVQIQGQAALVTGQRSSYRVELGSGNVFLEPSHRYLCIVPRSEASPLFLPFEKQDATTSEIISKILLLINDEQITDPTIVRQLVAV